MSIEVPAASQGTKRPDGLIPAPAGICEKGWPRKFMVTSEDDATMRPNLWLGGTAQLAGDWTDFERDLLPEANKGEVCVVCGEDLNALIVFGHTGKYFTNGPPAHPRCFAMALKFCPRYSKPPYTEKRRIVAYVYDKACGKPFLGQTEIRYNSGVLTSDYTLSTTTCKPFTRAKILKLVKENPLGLDTPH